MLPPRTRTKRIHFLRGVYLYGQWRDIARRGARSISRFRIFIEGLTAMEQYIIGIFMGCSLAFIRLHAHGIKSTRAVVAGGDCVRKFRTAWTVLNHFPLMFVKRYKWLGVICGNESWQDRQELHRDNVMFIINQAIPQLWERSRHWNISFYAIPLNFRTWLRVLHDPSWTSRDSREPRDFHNRDGWFARAFLRRLVVKLRPWTTANSGISFPRGLSLSRVQIAADRSPH